MIVVVVDLFVFLCKTTQHMNNMSVEDIVQEAYISALALGCIQEKKISCFLSLSVFRDQYIIILDHKML